MVEKINFDLDKEDWLEFNLYWIKNSPSSKKMKNRSLLALPILSVGIILLEGLNKGEWLIPIVVFGVANILWYVFYPKRYENRVLKNSEKMISEGKNKKLLGPHEIELSDSGIKEQTPSSKAEVNWDIIEKFVETDDYFYLFDSAVSAYILPKVAMDSIENVRSLIKENVN